MKAKRAIIVTDVVTVEKAICDHGCKDIVRLTNLLDGTTWEVCVLSFERCIASALEAVDQFARQSG